MDKNTAIVSKLFIASVCLFLAGCNANTSQLEPEITEIYTCEDNCTGERSRYLTKVYDGVTDEKQCSDLKGSIIESDDQKYCAVSEE
jgi:hypothetical protein